MKSLSLSKYLALRKQVFYSKTNLPFVRDRYIVADLKSSLVKISNVSFPDYSLHIEYYLVNFLYDKIKVPRYWSVIDKDDHTSIMMTKELAHPYNGSNDEVVLNRLAYYLSKLHAIKLDGFGLIYNLDGEQKGILPSWGHHLLNSLYADNIHLQAYLEFEVYDTDKYFDVIYNFAENYPLCRGSLLHGDLNNKNILMEDYEDIRCLIDWEDALVGDPVYDLAFWATFHEDSSKWNLLFDPYFGGEYRPTDFWYRFWIYYLRISISKIVLLQKYGFAELKRARNRVTTAYNELTKICL